jgi:hypothetical protein
LVGFEKKKRKIDDGTRSGHRDYIERKIVVCPEVFEWSIVIYSHGGVFNNFSPFLPDQNVRQNRATPSGSYQKIL